MCAQARLCRACGRDRSELRELFANCGVYSIEEFSDSDLFGFRTQTGETPLMRSFLKTLCLLVAIASCHFVFAGTTPQEADVPAQKFGKDGNVDGGFAKSHDSFVAQAKQGNCDFLAMGDSITAGWRGKANKVIFDKAFGQYKPLNFGIGGDRTQHVLWRLQNGELEGITPKVMMLMIGTNRSRRARRFCCSLFSRAGKNRTLSARNWRR
jgi:hypothetical protein